MTKHPNSRIVTIYRKDSFATNILKGSALDFISMSKQSIGSYFDNSNSKTIGSGLNFEEQRLLMPSLVDCEPSDRQFRAKVSEYFSNISTDVPFEKGHSLEIGLTKNNTAKLDDDNQPLNLADYIAYRHALGHPHVASTKSAGAGDMLKHFYIFDPAQVENEHLEANDSKDKALELYLKIKQKPEQVDMLLTLLDTDPRLFKGTNAAKLKLEALKKLAETKSTLFVSTFEDKHFDTLYILRSMVNTNVLKEVSKKVINPESGETLGHDTDEAIAWLKDPKNSETVVLLKARMQEGLSKPLPATLKATSRT